MSSCATTPLPITKRMILLLGLTTLTACVTRKTEPARVYTPEELRLKQKYRGIYGGVLCFDSRGKPKKHVTMYLPDGSVWRTALTIDLGTQQFTFPGALYIPTRLRVEWRTPDSVGKRRPNGRRDYHLGFEGGTVLGDYTLEIADRIPDELLDAIRQNGGALRIKIRLMDDRVLLGWDIEKRLVTQYGRGIVYLMPGGDFFEGEWGDGKYVRKPWHIDSQGQRIETEED